VRHARLPSDDAHRNCRALSIVRSNIVIKGKHMPMKLLSIVMLLIVRFAVNVRPAAALDVQSINSPQAGRSVAMLGVAGET